MMWVSLVFGGLKSILKRVLGFVSDYPWQAALVAALAFAGWLYIGKQDARADEARAVAKYQREAKARGDDLLAYRGAQALAAQKNADDVTRIEGEYVAIAQKSEKAYEENLTVNRRLVADFVRRARAAESATGGAQASCPTPVPGEPVQGAEAALVPVSDLEIVADAYAQLDALIAWAKSVGEVRTD